MEWIPMDICRFCRQEVDGLARRCPHCHADISLFGRLRPIVTTLCALGGIGFGVYEQWEAKYSKAEMKREQEALTTMLESVPDENIPDKYKSDKSEAELAAEVKKNPKDVKSRLRWHWARRRSRSGKQHPAASKSKTEVANRPARRTAHNSFNGRSRSRRRREDTATTQR